MSLDLYAGSLARYYSRDFETPQQRMAREFNLNYNLVYDGEPPDWPSRDVAAAKIVEFKNHIDEKQKHEFPDLTDWDDSVVDYRTEQLCREASVGRVERSDTRRLHIAVQVGGLRLRLEHRAKNMQQASSCPGLSRASLRHGSPILRDAPGDRRGSSG